MLSLQTEMPMPGKHSRNRLISERGRYPVTATEFHLIGKETERGWEQAEDISTLLPSLKHYERNVGTVSESLRDGLQKMSLNVLQTKTGLSRHTILRARQGKQVHPRSLQLLRMTVGIPNSERTHNRCLLFEILRWNPTYSSASHNGWIAAISPKTK